MVGSHDHVRGYSIVHVLRPGESVRVWMAVYILPILPIIWPARATNHGAGMWSMTPFLWRAGNFRVAKTPKTMTTVGKVAII